MAEGKRFSLDDIIAQEVAKKLSTVATSSGGGVESFGIKDIKDITSLLQELGKLAPKERQQQHQVQYPRGTPAGEPSTINKEQQYVGLPPPPPAPAPQRMAFDVPKLLDNFIEYIPMVITMYGDIPLSQVRELLVKERTMIILAVEKLIEDSQK